MEMIEEWSSEEVSEEVFEAFEVGGGEEEVSTMRRRVVIGVGEGGGVVKGVQAVVV